MIASKVPGHEYVYFRRDYSVSPEGERRLVWVGEHVGKMVVTSCCDTLEECMGEMLQMIAAYDFHSGAEGEPRFVEEEAEP